MRTIGALIGVILFGAISIGNTARAENNPLLAIYEGIEIGMDANFVNDTAENFIAWSELSIQDQFLPLSLTYDDAFIKWRWVGANYQNQITAPTASLEVHFAVEERDKPPKITWVVYRYNFLLHDKELKK